MPSARRPAPSARPAFILLVVLIMITLLSLLAAGYTFLVRAEVHSTQAVINDAQLRHAAESGIQRAILQLRGSNGDLDSWHDNPTVFRGGLIHSFADTGDSQTQNSLRQATGITPFGEKKSQQPANGAGASDSSLGPTLGPAWRYMLVGPNFDDPSKPRYGLTDECSKLDINRAGAEQLRRFFQSAIKVVADSNGTVNIDVNVLVDSLLDWRSPGAAARENGAKDDWYLANKTPGYRCKNAPFDSIDELLLVRGFDAKLLYGEDANRNGLLDANEDDGDANFPPDNADGILDRGIAPYLTVWAREYNTDSANRPRININNKDVDTLEQQLTNADDISPNVKEYILSTRRAGQNLGDPLSLITAPPEPAAEEVDNPLEDASTAQSSQPAPQQETLLNSSSIQPSARTPADSSSSNTPRTTPRIQTPPAGGDSTNGDSGSNDAGTSGGKAGGTHRQKAPDPAPAAGNAGEANSNNSTPRRGPRSGGRSSNPGGQSQDSQDTSFGVGRPGQRQNQQGGQETEQGQSLPSGASSRPGQQQGPQGPGTLDDLAGILDHLTTRPIPIYVGRINVSTAPKPVLMSLTELTEAQVDQLISTRATLDGKAKATPAWLVTQGVVRFSQLKALLPRITAQSATFAVESVGYADHLDAFKRLYVILEMRGPVGQILYYRDLTPLGPAYHPRGEDTRGAKNQQSQ